MKQLHTLIVSTLFFALAVSAPHAVEAPQLINYQGVLRDAMDAPQSGDFDMEFRFFDGDGGTSCPTVDGTLLLTDRHQAAGTGAVSVDKGIFNVALGSGELEPALAASLGDVFRGRSEVWLEVEVNGETLCPRTRVLASAYAIDAARESARDLDLDADGQSEVTLYVDGSVGGCGGGGCSDGNDGLTRDTAKQTIGGAVRAMPAVLNSDFNIMIAPGVYEESVMLSARVRTGHYFVNIVQDTPDPWNDPPTVTVQAPTPVPVTFWETGILVTDEFVVIAGLIVDGFEHGISGTGGSVLAVANCRVSNNGKGIVAMSGHSVELYGDIEVIDNTNNGEYTAVGIEAKFGYIEVQGSITFCGNEKPANAWANGYIKFDLEEGSSCTICPGDAPIPNGIDGGEVCTTGAP